MTIILLLFVFGIVLLFLDLFVPGIVLSILGTFALLAATARAFDMYGVGGGLLSFAIGMVLLATAMYIEYGILPKTRMGKKFFLHAHVKGSSQEEPANEKAALTGRECIALTPLVPTGQIELDGRRYEALSLDGRAERGDRLLVTGSQNFSLIVKKI